MNFIPHSRSRIAESPFLIPQFSFPEEVSPFSTIFGGRKPFPYRMHKGKGGHNMWDVDYLNHAPISDISVAVSGTVAQSGHEFLNEQWREAMNHGIFTKGARWQKGVVESLNTFEAPAFKFNTQSYKDLLATIPPLRSIPMIAIGRNGGAFGDDDTMKQSSDHALLAFFDSATTSIKFSIQDFGAGKEKDWFAKNLNLLPSWEEKIAEAVIKAIMKEVMVDALLSGKNAKPANGEHSE